MTATARRPHWGTARNLFRDHLILLLIVVGVVAVLTAVVGAGIALLGHVSSSVWDPAATLMRWLALGYGIYLFSTALPTHIAHGQTRRNYMVQATLFVAVGAAMVAALLTAGLALEAVVYDALDWTHRISDERLFTSPGQWGLALFSYAAVLFVWCMVGGFMSAAFYREDGWALVLLLPAVGLVILVGSAVGVSGLPFLGRALEIDTGSLLWSILASVAGALAGIGLTWAVVRDLPVRRRTG
jgi:hypothetical protein